MILKAIGITFSNDCFATLALRCSQSALGFESLRNPDSQDLMIMKRVCLSITRGCPVGDKFWIFSVRLEMIRRERIGIESLNETEFGIGSIDAQGRLQFCSVGKMR